VPSNTCVVCRVLGISVTDVVLRWKLTGRLGRDRAARISFYADQGEADMAQSSLRSSKLTRGSDIPCRTRLRATTEAACACLNACLRRLAGEMSRGLPTATKRKRYPPRVIQKSLITGFLLDTVNPTHPVTHPSHCCWRVSRLLFRHQESSRGSVIGRRVLRFLPARERLSARLLHPGPTNDRCAICSRLCLPSSTSLLGRHRYQMRG
jgi:hypothetical protein